MEGSLWPDFSDLGTIKMPKEILKEQAEYLVNITDGNLYGSVEEKKYYDSEGKIIKDSVVFRYDFFIKSKYVTNYRFKAFTISHDIVAYPININVDYEIGEEIDNIRDISNLYEEIEDNDFETFYIEGIKNEDDFKKMISYIFRTKKMKNVIVSLLSLS